MLSLISECSLQSTEKRSNRLQKSTPKVNLDEHSETGNYKYSGEEQKTREYYNTLSSHYGVEQFEITQEVSIAVTTPIAMLSQRNGKWAARSFDSFRILGP